MAVDLHGGQGVALGFVTTAPGVGGRADSVRYDFVFWLLSGIGSFTVENKVPCRTGGLRDDDTIETPAPRGSPAVYSVVDGVETIVLLCGEKVAVEDCV